MRISVRPRLFASPGFGEAGEPRAPAEFGEGIPAFAHAGANGVPPGWTLTERRQLGSDTLEVYTRATSAPRPEGA